MTYSTQEVAKILDVTDRTVRRYLSSYISFNNGSFEVSEKMLSILKSHYLGQPEDSLRTDLGQDEEYDIIEGFSNEEYDEFKTRLIEYPALKERVDYLLKDIEYHKKQIESHNRQMEIVLRNMEQRNFIEAKDKKLE
jgi:transcriptional regulator with XRE-family HTH domain